MKYKVGQRVKYRYGGKDNEYNPICRSEIIRVIGYYYELLNGALPTDSEILGLVRPLPPRSGKLL